MSVVIDHVSKQFGDTLALNDVSLEIQDGEFLAILGPSGCGKTTLLRTIAGFVQPTQGQIVVDGALYGSADYQMPVEQRGLGMVFQSFALWPHMSVRQNIEFPLKSRRNRQVSPAQRTKAVQAALASTGLTQLADRLPGELSGGQRQRVALARAIVEKPRLLLMDEPLSALDAELKVNMRKEIQDIHKLTGASIVYVTHDQSEALAMADRIMIMRGGKIEQIGTPAEIYYQPKTLFAASFVSKCNLVKGRWLGDCFFADCTADTPQPFSHGPVELCFRRAGVCPVRPEDLELSHTGRGLCGRVVNRQWGGREILYKIDCKGEILTVYGSLDTSFAEGEAVVLQKREASNEIAI